MKPLSEQIRAIVAPLRTSKLSQDEALALDAAIRLLVHRLLLDLTSEEVVDAAAEGVASTYHPSMGKPPVSEVTRKAARGALSAAKTFLEKP